MDWSHFPISAMQFETRFGDRVVPAFCERPGSIWAMIRDAVARNPDGEALVCGERRLSWRDLAQQSAQVAAGLHKVGVRRGDRVAVLLGNRIEFVLTLFGAAHLGAVTVLLGTRQQKPEIAYVLSDCGAKLLIHEAALADRLPDAQDVPALSHRISVSDGSPSQFAKLLAPAPAPVPADVGEEDTAMILYTSGTTGRPKGAMLAHCNIIHSAMVFVSCLKLTAEDRSIAAVPLGHVTGVVANIMTMVCCAGKLIIMAEFKAAEYLKVAASERVTYTVMVPAMYNLCLLQPDFGDYDLSSWRIGGFGGAPMPVATIEKLDARIPGLKLMNCYGATETTSPSTIMPGELTASHIDSVGLPCPGAEIVVMDGNGCELPRGEIGEIWIRSASVIRGYWNNPQATAESFTGGFWHSGDLGSIDKENFVRVFDRQKDMINRGGLKIYSAEVESVLAGHPGVVESAIIAKPCPVLGERVHAVIVTRDDSIRQDSLHAWCAERLSDYKVPETMALTSEPLPRNANGKVLKRQLREAWAAAQGEGGQSGDIGRPQSGAAATGLQR
ncbi:MAG TPA: class I adenylate-forming enzyme family protein [Bradyrhizobium sp.]|uniref:class I adenylate-forming enzyme family protein n=1 Tax=Bradyrhizobium sp. TaxID=376 RepID=UPI002CACD933|nr:class I adenylate-forming enzyme family protein [Bradyrhizobium sp.]HTB02849.1 class I adenylate-forming enzyme family protein [Bradyrhizobium sp.]